MNAEVWKDIIGFPGYKVSDKGRILSFKSGTPAFRKISENKYGYLYIHLSKDGKGKHSLIHRLVASAFLPNLDNKPQVSHIDGNKRNNAVNNLEWCTAKENKQHAITTGLHSLDYLRNNGMRVAREIVQLDINTNKVVCVWESSKAPKKQLGEKYDSAAILRCCKLQKDTYKGFRWRFKGEEHLKYEYKLPKTDVVCVLIDENWVEFESARAVSETFLINRNSVYRSISLGRLLCGKYPIKYKGGETNE